MSLTARGTVNLWANLCGVEANEVQRDKLASVIEEVYAAAYAVGYRDGQAGNVHKFPDQPITEPNQEDG